MYVFTYGNTYWTGQAFGSRREAKIYTENERNDFRIRKFLPKWGHWTITHDAFPLQTMQ